MENTKFFELRIYTVIPSAYPKLIELWASEGKYIIKKYMQCIGVWNTETGHLNKIFHLYSWRSHGEREKSRLNFYNDSLAQEYVEKVKPLYQSQESIILKSIDNLF
tara:strand:+ start:2519 stop:2836 length:318 start_codon:yes stop_codon:yes gene_type:complete